MKKKSLKAFAVCFMTASMISTAVLPALANEPAEQPAIEAAAQAPKLPSGKLNQSNCGRQVSKYDLVPGQYYVMRCMSTVADPMTGTVYSSNYYYDLIQVENVYEDYTPFFKLWSTRHANVVYCEDGSKANICCDNYDFFEPVV